ncbi:MAG: hypothetical protein ACRDIY_06925 [Chloroflexota bacterium]
MKGSRVVPLRIPENLDDLASLSAREQHTDKATALRQWIHGGATEYLLRLVGEGRLSLARAAELLDSTVYDLEHQARVRGIELGATAEQRRQSRELAARLTR